MNNKGYIKLHRSLLDWEWYDNINVKILFLHLLLTVNHEDANYQGMVVKKGQRVCSNRGLQKETGLSLEQVKNSLSKLESTHEITRNSTHQYTVITVENWVKFQCVEKNTTHQPTHDSNQYQPTNQPTNEEKKEKRKEAKEIKKEKKYKRKEEIKEKGTLKGTQKEKTTPQQVVELFNETCVSFPRVTKVSEDRKKAIKARLLRYSLNDFKCLFQKAEANSFLKGSNNRNWRATFDWLIKDSNFAKVIDGNYDNKTKANNGKERKVRIDKEAIKEMSWDILTDLNNGEEENEEPD